MDTLLPNQHLITCVPAGTVVLTHAKCSIYLFGKAATNWQCADVAVQTYR